MSAYICDEHGLTTEGLICCSKRRLVFKAKETVYRLELSAFAPEVAKRQAECRHDKPSIAAPIGGRICPECAKELE